MPKHGLIENLLKSWNMHESHPLESPGVTETCDDPTKMIVGATRFIVGGQHENKIQKLQISFVPSFNWTVVKLSSQVKLSSL